MGTLKSGTILVTKDHLTNGPALVFAHGAGEINHHDPIGALQLDTITLYRDENSGEFRYYFSDRKGKETSNPDLVDYCADTKNCKMKDLNLFPNVRAYIKSTLTSADIADFSSQGNVNAASVALILKQTVINDVAQELVTNKADYLGTALFHISSGTLGHKTITEYVHQDMPGEIAKEPAIQQAVANELKAEVTHRLAHNTRLKRSLKGDDGADDERGENGTPGPAGKDGVDGAPGPRGPAGQQGVSGPEGPEGKQGPIGQQGPQGEPGQGGTSLEIAHRLAHNSRFKRSLRGDDGTDGERGEAGTPGLPGPTGQPGPEGKQGPIGPAGQNGQDGRDADPVEVTHRLAHNARFKRSLKGDDGERGEQGDQGLKGDTGSEGPRGDRGERGEVGPEGPRGRDGEQGERGEQGEKGKDSVDSFPLDSESKRSIRELQKKTSIKNCIRRTL